MRMTITVICHYWYSGCFMHDNASDQVPEDLLCHSYHELVDPQTVKIRACSFSHCTNDMGKLQPAKDWYQRYLQCQNPINILLDAQTAVNIFGFHLGLVRHLH